ncbi:hypothetical protein GJAV_G00211170, partial [Gymnothorax javanicus]
VKLIFFSAEGSNTPSSVHIPGNLKRRRRSRLTQTGHEPGMLQGALKFRKVWLLSYSRRIDHSVASGLGRRLSPDLTSRVWDLRTDEFASDLTRPEVADECGGPVLEPQEPAAPRTPPCGTSDPVRLRPTLLGKRAFSEQPPSACPSCASLLISPPAMPASLCSHLLWDDRWSGDDRDRTVRRMSDKVPSRPRRVSAPASLSSSCGPPASLRTSNQNRTRVPLALGQNLVLELVANPLHQDGSCGSVGMAVENSRTSALEPIRTGSNLSPWGFLWNEMAHPLSCPTSPRSEALLPSLPPSPLPILSLSPSHCTAERGSVPMDTSPVPCQDASGCICDVPCSTAVGPGGACERAQSDRRSPQHHSVSSVTSQISSIHLTRESHLLSGNPVRPCPPQQEQSTTRQESVAVLLDCEEEEEQSGKSEIQCSGDDDDGSEASTPGDGPAAMLTLSKAEEQVAPEDCRVEKPPLVQSLFPYTPPTLYFSTANERVAMLPPEQSRLLRWKMSSVTPNVVKHTLARSHFKPTKKSHDWLGCWGHHMKALGFRAILQHQKLNHFPGSFQIGRKDRLWRNLSRMQGLFGRREFNFFPQSFVLPKDMKLLKKAWEQHGWRKWIIKPPASARGNGIQVICRWSQLPRRRPLLVQRYLHKPFLIDGSKFDLRIYVYVSSYDPLRVYIFTDGLVRFASCKYSSAVKTLSNKFMHLTNYSVNKANKEYQSNPDAHSCQGHKWSLKTLWKYLEGKGVNTTRIWEKIKDIVIKTIIAADPYVNALLQTHVRSAYSCHELFGFDIMLDENLKPWLLEVNISPSLHSTTALDLSVKGPMVRDMLNLAGFRLPQQEALDVADGSESSSLRSEVKEGSQEEKLKRAHYESQRFADQEFLSSVLEVLTPGDVRALVQSEDELSRRGAFERVFPSPVSSRYMRFFQTPRYLNILLCQWELRQRAHRGQGISLLKALCQRGAHLSSASDPTCEHHGPGFSPDGSVTGDLQPL